MRQSAGYINIFLSTKSVPAVSHCSKFSVCKLAIILGLRLSSPYLDSGLSSTEEYLEIQRPLTEKQNQGVHYLMSKLFFTEQRRDEPQ